ncbi:MAG: MarR family transcriptional regulator [Desulfuromonadales bacterium]|nr:MarR family transcriptional regulator [Desulfuromonadales bacterium]
MIKYDFEKSVSFWVGLTSHLFETALNNELAGTGITLRQVQVLACLAPYGELAQNELAMQLRIEPSTLVRILDRMERDGWIERCESPQDRRKKIVRPTEKVTTQWEKIVECGERMERRATAGLDPAQLDTLKETLAAIRRNLGAEM